jgi:LuxR family maltose regulon positive regulatory protein
MTLARVLVDQGTPESLKEADQLLAAMRVVADASNNTHYLIAILALQALCYDANGKEAEALSSLNHSILLAQPGGVLRLYVDMGPRMASLLSRLLRQGNASGYLKGILQAFSTQKPVPSVNGAKPLIEPLTDRELEILSLLAQRLSNKEIARELVISPMTVKRHTINIYQKLNTSSRREAVDVASALGLFSPQTLTA